MKLNSRIFKSLVFIFLCSIVNCFAQQIIKYDHRNPENPHYWSKNKPYEGYWQQDVYYKIDAILYDSLNLIDVPNYQLVYWNNSPDTLTEIYFHLYQNAFQPGSYMENLYLNNDQKVTFGKYEQEGLGTVYSNLTIDNQTVKITSRYLIETRVVNTVSHKS